MMNTKTYHAVLMDDDHSVTGQFTIPGNPRFLVVLGTCEQDAIVLGSDTAPGDDDLPEGAHVFARVGSAVWVDDEASALYEFVGAAW